MPLKLVTGPANSAKAGEVLGGLRQRLGDDPILVVPSFEDVEHSQRELAERGAVFGATVVRFDWLFREIAERAGYWERVASDTQRELIVEDAIRAARPHVLAKSAGRPGFVRAAVRFVQEIERSMIDPPRLTSALHQWAGSGPRRRYVDDVARIYTRYRAGLEAAGLADLELFAWRALDALRRQPATWRRTPVFVYGFDDFTTVELDALETLAGRAGADVTVSLPFEAGREAFRAVAPIEQALSPLASERVVLDAVPDHYASAARPALHHLERRLFELGPHEAVEPGSAVRLHSAGGERAEVELVAGEVLRLLRDGIAPGDVAVVFRDPRKYASIVEQVFDAYGIPFSIDRAVALAHTGLGRGLLALIRCAVLDAAAEDLLTYLRTPGKLRQPGLAAALERRVRQAGAESAADARTLWEAEWWPLEELDRLRDAPDLPAFLSELDRELGRLFAGPYHRLAPVFAGPELDDPRAFDAAHDALRELHALASTGHAVVLDRQRVHDLLAELTVAVGENPQPDRVQVADPGAIRARRFRAVFVCGLQEGEFPRGAAPEPFLPDADRRAIDLPLALREDQLDRERHLFYVCVSRAEQLLVLSSRYCDEEGNPQATSFFVDDVRELFEGLEVSRRRSLSDVTWEPEEAPTAAEWERSLALRGARVLDAEPGPLSAPRLLAELAERDAVSAGALERFADCPVKWLVEDLLRPVALEPDPEQMVRGRYAHKVLERTYARVRESTGDRRISAANLALAERILLEELRARRSEFRLSPSQTRVRAAVRRLEFDLLRYLRHEAERDGLFEPQHLELRFGFGDGNGDGHGEGPVEVATGVGVRGQIDRVDVWGRQAVVRDYKSGKSVDAYKVASWEKENRFQAALYMLVVERLLGLEPAGGVYEPLAGEKRKARGMVAKDVEELGSDFVDNDRLGPEEFAAKLEWARERIVETAAAMREGRLRCNPDSCAYDGGCSYPSICRVES